MDYIIKRDPETGYPSPSYLLRNTLKELIDSERIFDSSNGIEHKMEPNWNTRERLCSLNKKVNLWFLTEEETEEKKPLHLLIRDFVIYPSNPVIKLRITGSEVGFYYGDLVFPGSSLHFRNRSNYLLDESESGWGDKEAFPTKSVTERVWTEKEFRIMTKVEYQIK